MSAPDPIRNHPDEIAAFRATLAIGSASSRGLDAGPDMRELGGPGLVWDDLVDDRTLEGPGLTLMLWQTTSSPIWAALGMAERPICRLTRLWVAGAPVPVELAGADYDARRRRIAAEEIRAEDRARRERWGAWRPTGWKGRRPDDRDAPGAPPEAVGA